MLTIIFKLKISPGKTIYRQLYDLFFSQNYNSFDINGSDCTLTGRYHCEDPCLIRSPFWNTATGGLKRDTATQKTLFVGARWISNVCGSDGKINTRFDSVRNNCNWQGINWRVIGAASRRRVWPGNVKPRTTSWFLFAIATATASLCSTQMYRVNCRANV